jgi:hypothetical protein
VTEGVIIFFFFSNTKRNVTEPFSLQHHHKRSDGSMYCHHLLFISNIRPKEGDSNSCCHRLLLLYNTRPKEGDGKLPSPSSSFQTQGRR